MKPTKAIKTVLVVLLILSTLSAAFFGACLTLAVENDQYTASPTESMQDLFDPLLSREAVALFNLLDENYQLWVATDSLKAEIQNFEATTGVNFSVILNNEIIYTSINGTVPIDRYILREAYFNPNMKYDIEAYLYTPIKGTLPWYLYKGFQIVYGLRYLSIVFGVISVLNMLLCSFLLTRLAGKQLGTDEIKCSKFVRKTPYSILLLLFLAMAFAVTIGFAAVDHIELVWHSVDLWVYCLPLYIGILWLLFTWLLCLTVKKCRCKTFWNTGILYRIGRFLHRKLIAPLKPKCSYLWKNLSLWWKAGILFGGIFILSGLFLLLFGNACKFRLGGFTAFLVVAWLAAMAMLGAAFFFAVINLQQLKLGAKRIKEGGLSEKIDTSNMYWEFKDHANNLNTIGDGIKAAVAEQIKSERFQTELLTNVSHDIKTPMTSIINYVDLLDKLDLNDETAKEYIAVLTRQSARLKKLTEDLVEASKAQSGALTPHLANVNFSMLLHQALGEYTDRFEEKGLTPVMRLPDEEVYLFADNRMLWRILDNLFSNISKYAMDATRVYIDLLANGTLTVRNISAQEITVADEELTRRFVRGDASRSLSSGSGLGLSIALSLAELMEGSLKVQTDGDLFKVILTLPIGSKPTEN